MNLNLKELKNCKRKTAQLKIENQKKRQISEHNFKEQ